MFTSSTCFPPLTSSHFKAIRKWCVRKMKKKATSEKKRRKFVRVNVASTNELKYVKYNFHKLLRVFFTHYNLYIYASTC